MPDPTTVRPLPEPGTAPVPNDQAPDLDTTTAPPPQFEQLTLGFWGPHDTGRKPRRKLWYEFLTALRHKGAAMLAVAFALDANADSRGRTDASLSRLAKETGIGIRTFQRCLQRMVKTGAAWVERRFDPRTGRQTTNRVHLNQGWKRHPRTYRKNVSAGDSPRHSDTPPPSQWHPLKSVQAEVSTCIFEAADAGTSRASTGDQQPDVSPEGQRLIDALAGRSREHDLPFAEDAVRRRLAAGELTNADLRHRLNQLPPRLATLTAEQWAADEAAGLVDRARKGGYPPPPDDPRFTVDDDHEEDR